MKIFAEYKLRYLQNMCIFRRGTLFVMRDIYYWLIYEPQREKKLFLSILYYGALCEYDNPPH